MKKPFFFLLIITICSLHAKSQTAESYFKAGSDKMIEKPDPSDRLLKYKQAMQYFDKAIAINPAYEQAYEKRALVRRGLGDYNGAIRDAEKILSMQPKNKNAWYFIGQSKLFQRDYNGSIKAFTQAITIDAAYVDCYYDRGRCEKELNNLDASLKDFNKAITISGPDNPMNKFYFSSRGMLKLTLKDNAGACTDLKKAFALGDNNAQILLDHNCK